MYTTAYVKGSPTSFSYQCEHMPTVRPDTTAHNTPSHTLDTLVKAHTERCQGARPQICMGHTHTPHTPRHTLTFTLGITWSTVRTETHRPHAHTEPLPNTQTGTHIQVAAARLPHRHVVSSPSVSSGKEKRTGSVHPDLQDLQAPQPLADIQREARFSSMSTGLPCICLPSGDSPPTALPQRLPGPCYVHLTPILFLKHACRVPEDRLLLIGYSFQCFNTRPHRAPMTTLSSPALMSTCFPLPSHFKGNKAHSPR